MSDDQTTDSNKVFNLKAAPKIGLALGAGVARGFAHIGVIKAMNKHGIRPTMVAGTSIGALVGASYVTGKMEALEEWALSLNRRSMFSYIDFRVRSGGLIGGKKLEKLLTQHFGDMLIEDLPIPFTAIATDMLTGHEVWIRKGRLVDALQASFALPGVFPPVQMNQRQLLDGALVNPVPVSTLQALGARITIAVDLNGDLIGKASKPGKNYQTALGFDLLDEVKKSSKQKRRFSPNFGRRLFRRDKNSPSLFGVMVSALNIIQDRLTRSRLAGDPPDIHIKPQIGHIGLLEFEKAEELIALGQDVFEKHLEEIDAAMTVLLPYASRD
jgi:NTE family protein